MTRSEKIRAQKMRNEGLTYKKIGEMLDMSYSMIRRGICPGAREQNLARNAIYAQEHKAEKIALREERRAAYRKEHKAEIEANIAEHVEARKKKSALYAKAYHSKRKLKTAAYNAQYRATHKDKYAFLMREWRQNNTDKVNAYSAHRRALKAGALIGSTASQLAELKEIYRKAHEDIHVRCYLCGGLIPKGHRHVDHIVPLSKGGAHRPSNLAVACDACNMHKHTKMPEQIGLLM